MHLVVMTDELLLLMYESFCIYKLLYLVTTFMGHLVSRRIEQFACLSAD